MASRNYRKLGLRKATNNLGRILGIEILSGAAARTGILSKSRNKNLIKKREGFVWQKTKQIYVRIEDK